MRKTIELFHGSREIVRIPEYGKGRKHDDYGLGFYCTENIEIAKEWACSSLSDGYVNHYLLDASDLRILDLSCEDYTILNWISVLTANRLFRPGTPVAGRAIRYLKENFQVNVNAYDVIKGYRADDAYYDFADAFLNNAITVEQLAQAMCLGKLGEQIVIKSQRAFDKLSFTGFETADSKIYYPARKARFDAAEMQYRRLSDQHEDGLYMIDLIREKVRNDDPRIPRNAPQKGNA